MSLFPTSEDKAYGRGFDEASEMYAPMLESREETITTLRAENATLKADVERLKGRWIPASERLPEGSDRYAIVYTQGRQTKPFVADWDSVEQRWLNMWEGVAVIHWMPLPPTPEKPE